MLSPVVVTVFGYPLTYSALFVAAGLLCGTVVSLLLGKKRGLVTAPLLCAALSSGFIFARAAYIAFDLRYASGDLMWYRLSDGGFSVMGAVYGTIAALLIYTLPRGQRKLLASYADVLAVGGSIAIAIGRIGNIFNREYLGIVCENTGTSGNPFFIFSEVYGEYHLSLGLVEAILCTLLFAVLLILFRKRANGNAAVLFISVYCAIRGALGALQYDFSMKIGLVNASQVLAAALMLMQMTVLTVLCIKRDGVKPRVLASAVLFMGALTLAAHFAFVIACTEPRVWEFVSLITAFAVLCICVNLCWQMILPNMKGNDANGGQNI